MAVTEGWAALFEHLVDEPAWLNRRLDVPERREDRERRARSRRLYFLRRYSAKLLYEIEFFQADDPATMRPRYAELLTDALKLPGEPRELPRRHRRLVLRHRLPALVGVRGAAPRLPALRVRQRLVRAARGRRPPARAVVARPGPDRRRAPARRHRRAARDGLDRRADPRRPRRRRREQLSVGPRELGRARQDDRAAAKASREANLAIAPQCRHARDRGRGVRRSNERQRLRRLTCRGSIVFIVPVQDCNQQQNKI